MRLGFSSSCKGAAACCQLQAHPLCSFLTKSSLCFLSRNVAFLHLFTKYDRTRVICDWNGCMHWRYDHSHGTAERVFIGCASEANFCINRADAFHTRVLSRPANTQCDVRCIGAQIFFQVLKMFSCFLMNRISLDFLWNLKSCVHTNKHVLSGYTEKHL